MKKLLKTYKSLPVQVKASFWFLICSFLQKGIAMITTPIFTRILSTQEYGQFSVFNSWMSIITPIVCLNLYSGIYSQGLVKFEKDRSKFSSSLQGLALTLVTLWTGIYLVTCSFWNDLFSLTTVQMVCMLILIWTSAAYNFWAVDQRVDFKYRKQVVLTLLMSTIQPSVCIWFILNSDDKVTARIVGMTVVHIALYLGTFIVQMARGKQFFSKHYWMYASKFNIPLLPHYLSMTVLSSSDRIMISNMVGNEKAGIYSLAYSISQIMTMFNTALLQTIEPWIYRKLKDKKVYDIAHVAYPCFILIAVLNLLLIIFAPEIVTIFAPREYQEAIWCIPAVALSVFFTFLYTFFATFEFYYEKTKYIAVATMGGAVLNIVLNYIFINLFGYMAAAYTTLFSYILYAVLHYYFMHRICKMYLDDAKPYSLKLIIMIATISLAVGLGIMATYTNAIVRWILIAAFVIVAIIKRNYILRVAEMLVNVRNQKDGEEK